MKTIKIGQINWYQHQEWGDTGLYRMHRLVDKLNHFSTKYKYEYADCLNDNCDIVFYSLYNTLSNLQNVKGNPQLIYWTDELDCVGYEYIVNDPFTYYKNGNPSISFYDDSEDNLFFPYFALFIEEYLYTQYMIQLGNIKLENINKNKFCTFCASNDTMYNSDFRTNVVKYINDNYKTITCCGKVLNNTNNEYLPWDVNDRIIYHKDYKFYLCFENKESSGNLTYLTEKIINGFTYNTVPIYWGAERVIEWFNPDAFINCNGLNNQQILDKIKEVDNNEELYNYMKSQHIFLKENFNYDEYFTQKIENFILKYIK